MIVKVRKRVRGCARVSTPYLGLRRYASLETKAFSDENIWFSSTTSMFMGIVVVFCKVVRYIVRAFPSAIKL
uniref:Transmembrane protein n=1 Tax=Caenorhabditis tropicalis TaxID=1561998 RepID=A0A1I7UBQ0_9PELO